ncbi:uncharacterized protein [Dysidea avara]|uniref:uncharacterized protein isoform X2 n=1 Tax=Dysidea avara TaxID=196820 RepID=UPI00331D7BCA
MSDIDCSQAQDENLAVQIKSLTHEDLAIWLNQCNIPQRFCTIFEDNYIDGTTFLQFEEQDIRELIPGAIGIVKKLLRLIPKDAELTTSGHNSSISTDSSSTDQNLSASIISPVSRPASPMASQAMAPSMVSPVKIPTHWRPDTLKCIKQKSLSCDSRNDIVRTLVSIMMSKVGAKPTRGQCEQAARDLILKYPFMKDDIGDGYLSWVEKMIERIRNVNKADKKKSIDLYDEEQAETPKRKRKLIDDLSRRYSVTTGNSHSSVNSETIEQHHKAIKEEMIRAKPRERLLLPLMKSTFPVRWCFIKNEAESVKQVLEAYPCLKLPIIIEQELNLVMESTEKKAHFMKEWSKYAPAIISYGRKQTNRTLIGLLRNFNDAEDDTSTNVTAFKVLCTLLTPKQARNGIEYLYNEYNSVPVVSVADQELPSPSIAAFIDETNEHYFIYIEGSILCKSTRFSDALFLMFASYYIFNLKYPAKAKSVLYFLQDYIFGYADSCGMNATYLATVSDIKRHLECMQ